MQYISTRGGAAPVDFVTACLSGLAPDGGLYVPKAWPTVAPARVDEPYPELAARILSTFAGDSLPADDVAAICKRAYASFSHAAVAPLTQWGAGRWLMELHHGPTLAFKDVAMQFIAQFYDHVLGATGDRMTIVCATSGDTGGAAAYAFAGTRQVDLVILHPHERISPVQRLFMTTTGASNVHNLAVDGDFDDCQAMVKAMFADRDFSREVALSGVNSINWARIGAQLVYFAAAQAALGPDQPIRFVVPSGNMGDALAGYVARQCGLLAPGGEIVCAVNENQVLADFLQTGEMTQTPAVPTPSPAMDISTPSNAERLIFDLYEGDSAEVAAFYETYRQTGAAALKPAALDRLNSIAVTGHAVSNRDTEAEMNRYADETGTLICPHTAVGTYVARRLPLSPLVDVVLSTAHAAKFPDTVETAAGRRPELPAYARDVGDRPEAFTRIASDLTAVKAHIVAARAGG